MPKFTFLLKWKTKFICWKCWKSALEMQMLFFSCVLRDSMTSYVGQSVTVSFFGVFGRLLNTAPAQMLKLAFFITAPAHPHATLVAVYPA